MFSDAAVNVVAFILLCLCHPTVSFACPFVRRDLVAVPSHNGLNSFDEIYTEYLVVSTDDLVRFWRSKVKVTAGCRRGEGIHVSAVASTFIKDRRSFPKQSSFLLFCFTVCD